jgi:hypothetical protein
MFAPKKRPGPAAQAWLNRFEQTGNFFPAMERFLYDIRLNRNDRSRLRYRPNLAAMGQRLVCNVARLLKLGECSANRALRELERANYLGAGDSWAFGYQG